MLSSANIQIPIAYFDEIRFNQAIELLEIINTEASQLKEFFDKKSETENSKWYREKLAKFFMALSLLSSLSIIGLSIATKFTTDSLKTTLSDVSNYASYGTIFTAVLGVFFNISPDVIPLSIKKMFKEFTPDQIEQLSKFAADLYRLQNNAKSAYYHDSMIELTSSFLYDISQQFQNLSLLSINTAKACLDKMPLITNNLNLLFSKTVYDKTKSHLNISSDYLPKEKLTMDNDSDEEIIYIENDNDYENESLLNPQLIIRQG